MGMNGDKLLPIHPPGGWMGDEWGMNGWGEDIGRGYYSSPIHPIHPPGDEWVKVYPHSSAMSCTCYQKAMKYRVCDFANLA